MNQDEALALAKRLWGENAFAKNERHRRETRFAVHEFTGYYVEPFALAAKRR